MNYLLIRHQVADFAHWKTAYDAHAAARTRAGLKEKELLQEVGNPNQVVMLFAVEDLQRAQDFVASADLREAMSTAGVTDKPDLFFLTR